MQTYYGKFVDKMIPPKIERRFHLGRRSEFDRRLMEEDRRGTAHDAFLYSRSRRRDREEDRRSGELHEQRRRWFNTNKWQSRHF